MLSCSIINCSNNQENSDSVKVKFHRPPTNLRTRKKWLTMCVGHQATTSIRVCSDHFTDDDYEVFVKNDSIEPTSKRLKRNIIPHVHIPTDIVGDTNSPPSPESSNPSEEGERRYLRRHTLERLNNEKFMENFNPETSARETRKVNRKVLNQMRYRGNLHDVQGVHIRTGKDLCDCCEEECPGCHYPCPKCGSQKCGPVCRVNRKWVYEQNEIEGTDYVFKHPTK